VLFYHNNNITKALVDLFPNIGLDPAKFIYVSYWDKSENRRIFFENYAKKYDFDPLVPKNWYSQPRNKLMAVVVSRE
jgi:hypothetical protein